MKKRIEIEMADNGYMITIYGGKKETKADPYPSPEKMVAQTDEEVLEIVRDNLA